jgi:hypothetical protein
MRCISLVFIVAKLTEAHGIDLLLVRAPPVSDGNGSTGPLAFDSQLALFEESEALVPCFYRAKSHQDYPKVISFCLYVCCVASGCIVVLFEICVFMLYARTSLFLKDTP